jgi:hypothetical protein
VSERRDGGRELKSTDREIVPGNIAEWRKQSTRNRAREREREGTLRRRCTANENLHMNHCSDSGSRGNLKMDPAAILV